MSGKNLVLELWSKNLKTNQNAGFFKLQYFTKKLSCEVKFFEYGQMYMKATKNSNKKNLDMPKVMKNNDSVLSQE